MSTRAAQHVATVAAREPLSDHLLRLTLTGLDSLVSTRIPDEWVGLIVPGQFQSRYYTVRSLVDGVLTLDVVVHDDGLVTRWATGDCVGDQVTITEPRGSFAPPVDGWWHYLVGDLTALPAMARITETLGPDAHVMVWAEAPEPVPDYFPDWVEGQGNLTWLDPPPPGTSRLADWVEGLPWPEGPGYFWMGGESAQMRAIRKHLMREVGLASDHYDVMGYWRQVRERQPRAVDPGPSYRAGRAAGKTDEQIWADYDAAREQTDG